MRTETIAIYKFDELPDEAARETARQWWRGISDYLWMEESRESIDAFCSEFGVYLTSWSVGAFAPFEYATNAKNEHFRGRRLREFKRDHMPTGYCLDCSLWVTFYDEFKRTGDAKGAFDAALWEGFKDWRNDLEWQLSDEYIDEHLTANEYEFDEDGRAI